MKRAVYAGSFDPPTNGHLWMINQASAMFDLTVAIAANPYKRSRVKDGERFEMLKSIWGGKIATIGNEFLVNWATARGFDVLIRGMRNASDFEYECAMSSVNGDIGPGITTVFLVPPRHLREISSSMVMSLAGIDGWEAVVSRYVPAPILQALKGSR